MKDECYGGATAALVEPLLSLLFDLRRLESIILATIEQLGAPADRLPPLFRADAAAAAPGRPSDVAEAEPSSTGSSNSTELLVDAAAVERLLKWVDQHSGSRNRGSSPHPNTCVSSGNGVKGVDGSSWLSLTATLLAADEMSDPYFVEADTQQETHLISFLKRRKFEPQQPLHQPACANSGDNGSHTAASPVKDERRFICSLTEAAMQEMVGRWRRFEDTLKRATTDLAATIHAVSAGSIRSSLCCHAKWVESTSKDLTAFCTTPASQVLQKNYEEFVLLLDALSTCQSGLHQSFAALEDDLERYVEEVVVVGQQHRRFVEHVSLAKRELQALQTLRLRLRAARRAAESATAA